MKNAFIALLLMLAMVFTVMPANATTAPAEPEPTSEVETDTDGEAVEEDVRTDEPLARQASNWECYRLSRTARDVYAWDWWGSRILDWRAKLIVTKCESAFEYYYVLREMKYSMEHLTENRDCSLGDIDYWRLNPFPVGGVNPPTKDWACDGGKDKYTWSFDMGDERLYPGEGDRCFSLDWRVVITAHSDLSDPSPSTKCLA